MMLLGLILALVQSLPINGCQLLPAFEQSVAAFEERVELRLLAGRWRKA